MLVLPTGMNWCASTSIFIKEMTSSANLRRLLICVGMTGILLIFGQLAMAETSVTNATGEAPAHRRGAYISQQSYWNRYVGEVLLSGGFSKEFNYGSVLGAKTVLDYFVASNVSIGAQGGYYRTSSPGNYETTCIGIRTSYHLLRPKLHRRQNPWGVYTGASVECEIGGGQKDWHEKRIFADVHLGFRCRLTPNWYLWSEAALNNATIGVSVRL